MKFVKLGLGAVVGVAAVWSAGWYAGRTLYVEPEADKAVEDLRAGDLFFTYDQRQISGFPFAYDVAYVNGVLSSSTKTWRWTVPSLTVRSGIADGGALTLRPSDESQLALTITVEELDEPEFATVFDIKTDDLVFTLQSSEKDATFEARSEAFSLTQAEDNSALQGAAVVFDVLEVSGTSDAAGSVLAVDVAADRAEMAYALKIEGMADSETQLEFFDFTTTVNVDGADAASLADFVNEKKGASLKMAFSRLAGSGESTGDAFTPPLKVTYSGGANTADMALENGVLSYVAKGDATEYLIEMPDPLPNGKISIATMNMDFAMPLRKTEEPSDYSVSFDFDTLEMDDGIWDAFDPSNGLGRAPLSLSLDLGGQLRMLSEFGAPAVPGVPPLEVDTVSIRKAEITGLDAALSATGELTEISHPVMPKGTIELVATGWPGLAERIVKAGLIPQNEMGFYNALIDSYAVEGEAPDTLVAKIDANPLAGITINDKPL